MNRGITPVESKLVAFVALGEGWHNYHHVFPWDYKTAELGDYGLNFSTAFIDFFAKIGTIFLIEFIINIIHCCFCRLGL